MRSAAVTLSLMGERSYRRAIYRQDPAGNAGNRARQPPRADKLRPRAQRGHVRALTTSSSARRALRSATMLAVRLWLGFGSQNTAQGAGTATSGGALTALADAASGGACFCAACARLADRVAAAAFALTPSLPARAQGHGRTSVSPAGVVAAVEEGEQQVPPLSSTGAVYPWRTGHRTLSPAEGCC